MDNTEKQIAIAEIHEARTHISNAMHEIPNHLNVYKKLDDLLNMTEEIITTDLT
jgi:hypothetical protein